MRRLLASSVALAALAVPAAAQPPPAFNPATGALTQQVGPCEIIASGGQRCAAAHSITRRMFSDYVGPLIQLQRLSDSTNQDIGSIASGMIDVAAVETFCLGTDCYVMTLYDQSGNANHLWAGTTEPTPDAAAASPWAIHRQLNLPVLQTGFFLATNKYRNRGHTSGLPTGAAASMTYYVRPTDIFGRYGDYGRGENPFATACSAPDTVTCPAGASFALSFANATGLGANFGPAYTTANTQAYIGIDEEYYMLSFPRASFAAQMMQLGKTDGTNITIKYGDAVAGDLATIANIRSPWAPLRVQNGLQFSEGGDATNGGAQFYEGAIVTGQTSDATDALLAANVKAFYGSAAATPAAPWHDVYAAGGANNNGAVQLGQASGGMWGLRRMRAGYTGYAASVSRESDSTSINVGFDANGNFDDLTAQAFCAGTTCHALPMNQAFTFQNATANHSKYDMSQATLLTRPTLVFNGLNGRTVMAFSGTQYMCTTASTANSLTPTWWINAVAKRTGATAQSLVGGTGAAVYGLGWVATANTSSVLTAAGTTLTGATFTDGTWGSMLGRNLNGSASSQVNNGTAVTASQTTGLISGQICIGAGTTAGTTKFTGSLAEVVIGTTSGGMTAPTDAQFTALYADQRAYYGGAF